MEEVIKQQELAESGTDANGSNPESRLRQLQSRAFEVRQGIRRRHPTSVLSNYAAVTETNNNPHTTWEKSLEEENEMSSLPKVYQTQGQLSAVQLGIVRTAEENYAKSKNKLSTMYVTGV
jgi:predicted ATP-binding protein involved in virulence